ncbi:unnamed protein product [Durusdinium trenchii]|uniref:Uncharacterized protein n=1 Tax=Durusdinium trenchii TaxID=1381693 RepID=A0ABP0L428_9DINO
MTNDDLELDGNWAVTPKKRNRDQILQTGPSDPDGTDEADGATSKRRKGGRVLEAVLASEAAPQSSKALGLKKWAKNRIATSWIAEAKSKKLAPLEVKELKPMTSWFLPCPPQLTVEQLPEWAAKAPSVLKGFGSEEPKKGSVKVLALCASTDRVFAIKAAWDAAFPHLKALALAAHGGGRKKDQVLRQAKALEQGTALAVATPARLSRLKAEGHIEMSKIGVVLLDLAKDVKRRDVLTLQDTRSDFFKFLREIQHLLPRSRKAAKAIPEGLTLLLCGLPA